MALVDALTDEQAAELNKLIDSGKDSPEDVRDFLTAAGVDISEVTSKTLQEFHAKYADEVINAEEE